MVVYCVQAESRLHCNLRIACLGGITLAPKVNRRSLSDFVSLLRQRNGDETIEIMSPLDDFCETVSICRHVDENFHLKCQGQVAESLLASLGEQGWCPDLKWWCFSTTLTSG